MYLLEFRHSAHKRKTNNSARSFYSPERVPVTHCSLYITYYSTCEINFNQHSFVPNSHLLCARPPPFLVGWEDAKKITRTLRCWFKNVVCTDIYQWKRVETHPNKNSIVQVVVDMYRGGNEHPSDGVTGIVIVTD